MTLNRLDIASNVYLSWRFVDRSLQDAQSLYVDRGLPQAAAGTVLESVMGRACKTNIQYAARVLAFDSLTQHNPQAMQSVCHSLSHTPGAVAFVWGDSTDIEAVGVDIEPMGRRLEAKHDKFFLNRSDRIVGLDRMTVWCLKEAAFKCLDQFVGGAGLLDIEIRPDLVRSHWRCRLADKICSAVSVETVVGHRIAVAWSSRCLDNSPAN